MIYKNIFLPIMCLLLTTTNTWAVPNAITLQTKIINPSGSALEAPSVNFQITTLDSLGTCVLYVETFGGVSMTNSGGVSVSKLGSGAVVYSATGGAYSTIFNNQATSYNCQAGGTFVPASTDNRKIIMQFNDGTAAGWQTTPAVEINSVPFAQYASDTEKFSGHLASDFTLKTAFPDCNTAGKVLTFNGTSFTCVSPSAGSGTVTNVTSANSYIGVATGTSTPVITANVGTAANTLAAGNDTRITGAAQKANNLSDLASAATARTNLGSTTTGDALFTTGSAGAARTTLGSTTVGDALFTSASATAARTTLGLGTASVLDAGTAANNLVQLDGTAKIPSALLPASATYWQAATGGINYGSGNVGIGTTTPSYLLHVIDAKTDPAASYSAAAFTSNTTFTTNNANYAYGVMSSVTPTVNAGASLSAGIVGIQNSANVVTGSAGTVANIFGIYNTFGLQGGTTATATSVYGIYSRPLFYSGTVGTNYNLYLAAPGTGATVGTEYAIYQASTTARNYYLGKTGLGLLTPTATMHIKAGTATAGTAPLKFTTGVNLTTPEAGAIEYDGTNLYYTDSTPTRRTIATTGGTGNSFTGVTSVANSAGNISLDPNSTTGSVLVSSSTASTGAASGALVVTGGVGVGGAINSTGSISSGGSISAITSMLTPQIYGSAIASGSIKIDGTSHATKGSVLLNSAGGNVGIGTNNAGAKLTVVGTDGWNSGTGLLNLSNSSSSTNGPAILLDGTAGASGRKYAISSTTASDNSGTGNFQIFDATAAATRMVINSSGAVGIGTTSPATGLTLDTNVGATPFLSFGANNVGFGTSSATWSMRMGGNAISTYGNNLTLNATGAASQSIIFQTVNSGVGSEKMRIDNVGNVGIGTNAPSGTLEVAGGTAAAATNGTNITLTAQSAGTGNQNGGNIVLAPGAKTGTGYNGAVLIGATTAPSWIGTNSIYVTGMNYANQGYQVNNGFGINFGTSSASLLGTGGSTTSDYVAFRTNSTERMRLDGSGNIGIGTATPAFKLDVAGTIRSSTGGFSFPDGTVMTTAGVGTSTGMTSTTDLNFAADSDANTTGEMIFATAGTERMRIANAGAIGIGVTTPSATSKLNIQDASTKTPLQLTTPGGAVGDSLYIGVNGRARFGYDGGRGAVAISDRDVSGTTTSKPIVFDTGAAERMRIDATGNVGIGIAAPGAKLDLIGDAGATSGFQPLAKFYRGAGNAGGIGLGYWADGTTDTASAIRTTGVASDLVFAPNVSSTATERMRITSAGYVGINTSTPGVPLDVNGDVRVKTGNRLYVNTIYNVTNGVNSAVNLTANGTTIDRSVADANPSLIVNQTHASSTGDILQLKNSGGVVATVTQTGRLGVGVASPTQAIDVVGNIQTSGCLYYASSSLGTCASDEQIKKDVHSYDLGLNALLGINPVTFKYNGLAGFKADGREQLGVIAQQVEKVAPSLVKRQMVQLHENDSEKTEIKVVDYGAFTYVIINAVKDFYAKWSDDSKAIHRSIASVEDKTILLEQQNALKDQQIKKLEQENIEFKLRLEKIEKQLRSK